MGRYRCSQKKALAAAEFDRVVAAEYVLTVDQVESGLRAMDAVLEKASQLPLYAKHVAWLRCFHGIDTTSAMIFVAEQQSDSSSKRPSFAGLLRLWSSRQNEYRKEECRLLDNIHFMAASTAGCAKSV